MKIDKTAPDNLMSTISVVIEKGDYEPKFNSELSKQQKNAALKGFRKGKTPMSFVKKVYGNEILSKIINQEVMGSLQKYIQDEGLLTIGTAIPSEDHEQIDIDYKSLEDFTFKFDVGLAPEFDVAGAQESDKYVQIVPEVEEEKIDEEMQRMRKMFGTRETVEDKIEAGDSIMLHGFEQEGGAAKVAGKEISFQVLVDDLEDQYKDQVLKLKKGDKLSFDVYNLEKGKTKEFVDKYLLKLDEGEEVGSDYEAEIVEVSRILEAELTEEFLAKVFRDQEVKTEAEARDNIKNQLAGHYRAEGRNLMFRNIMNNLMESNSFDLPESFIDRWLFGENQTITAEEKEKQLAESLKEIKWSVIRSKLSKQFDVKIEEPQIMDRVKMKASQMVRQYGLGPAAVQEVLQMILQNEREMQQIYLELESEQMFEKLSDHVTVEEKPMSYADYEKERDNILNKDK